MGERTVFIRLTGCPLRCVWCDSEYAFNGGTQREVSDLVDEAASFNAPYVCVTGGEPLAQPEVHTLLTGLADRGVSVSLETSGAMSLANVDPRVIKVMDLKAPDSGESHRNLWENLTYLKSGDQLKVVLSSRQDYEWLRMQIDQRGLDRLPATLLVSPVHGTLAPRQLAEWVLEDQLPVRFQVQLHKYLWGEEPGH